MNIGKQIKRLRIEKNVTQEVLADYLMVSSQAVSKWENGVTTPDIALLPELSVFFGVKIDEFFKLPSDAHYKRIENMLMHEKDISEEHFQYAESFLNDMVRNDEKDARALGNLAHLYNHKAKSLKSVAGDYAKKALTFEPEVKSHHNALWDALGAVCGDDHYDNHYEVIGYYKDFLANNPDHIRALVTLIENLMADGRYLESKDYVEKLAKLEKDYRYHIYLGDMALGQGDLESALKSWDASVEKHKDVWQVYCSRGDRFRRLGRLDQALEDYEKAMVVQEAPAFTDALIAMAQVYEDQGKYDQAIEVRERQLKILKEDFGYEAGENIDYPKREIERLLKKTL